MQTGVNGQVYKNYTATVVVVRTRYCIYLHTPIGLFATTLHSDGTKFNVQFVQHCQNINRKMIIAEISRPRDENVHRSAYVVCSC